MVYQYIESIMQISSIGLVIAAAGLWAGAGVTARPKDRDEQTLIGGAIWSQIIIPIGLMISKVVQETVDKFVQGYYLVTGILLLWITGILLIVQELRHYKRRVVSLRAEDTPENSSEPQTSRAREFFNKAAALTHNTGKIKKYPYDKAYYAIGVLCFLAGAVKLAELIVHETRRYKRRVEREKLKLAMSKVVSFRAEETPANNSELQTREKLKLAMGKVVSFRAEETPANNSEPQTSRRRELVGTKYPYDKAYYAIGVLCFLAGAVKLAELVMFVILDMSVLF